MNPESRPILIVVAGPNGSGKTTITEKLLRHEWMEGCVYVNPDQIAQDEFGDWNAPDAVLKAANKSVLQVLGELRFCFADRRPCLFL